MNPAHQIIFFTNQWIAINTNAMFSSGWPLWVAYGMAGVSIVLLSVLMLTIRDALIED